MIGNGTSRYRLLNELGAGGMGVVYRAEDLMLRREVALKVLSPAFSLTTKAVERFLLEARASAALNHPNLCTVYDAGEHDGKPYIAMELLQGRTLRERIAAGPTTVAQVLDLAIQIADGLAAAHAKGIIHRDIKPANVHVSEDGWVKILDFGLAKPLPLLPETAETTDTPPEAVQLTAGATVVGTVAYMSPEQASGEPLDTRTDLFSFGVVLYELCAGRLPFAGRTSAVVYNAILSHTPAPLADAMPAIPAELARIIDKALAKDRKHRYQQASEMAADLRSLKQWLEAGGPADGSRAAASASTRPSDGAKSSAAASAPSHTPAALRDYLERFPDADVQHRRLRHYVWPAATIEDPFSGQEMAVGQAQQLVKAALVGDPDAFVLLLGDYGSGKTSFLQMLGRELATDAMTGAPDRPFPIYLNLGSARQTPDLLEAVSAYLARYGVPVSPEALRDFLVTRRTVVLLLDGFDEMAGWVDYKAVPEILEKIRRLQSVSGVRIVLSGRTSFFRSDVEVGIVGASHVVRLRPFDDQSMLDYVSRRDPNLTSRVTALFDRHADLRALCRNPIHLMLFMNWLGSPDRSSGQAIPVSGDRPAPAPPVYPEDFSVVELYHRFFAKTLQDNFGTITTWPLNQRWAFVRRLAWHWFNEGIFEWPMAEFSKRIQAELGELSRDEVDRYTLQLLNCTFFTRVGDHYRFLHRSYLEYLVSQALCEALWAGDLTAWEIVIYTDIYEMSYQMLRARGLEKLDMDWVMAKGSLRAQANILAMAWRHHPPIIEPHVRKQLRYSPYDIVRFLAAMGLALYTPSRENVECLVDAFAHEQNTVVRGMIQRVGSNWLADTTAPELRHALQPVVEIPIELRTEDAARATLQRPDVKDGERILLAFRRAMVQGDRLWPAAVGGILGLGVVKHASSFSYIHKVASEAAHREIRAAYGLVRPFTGLPEIPLG